MFKFQFCEMSREIDGSEVCEARDKVYKLVILFDTNTRRKTLGIAFCPATSRKTQHVYA